jgi:hypothetical protein
MESTMHEPGTANENTSNNDKVEKLLASVDINVSE